MKPFWTPAKRRMRAATRESHDPVKLVNLLEEILDKQNLNRAYRQILSNKGARTPGVDRMTVPQLKAYMQKHWPKIEEQLRQGTYQPLPVKRVEIPKPGGGVRKLGIPSALDRLLQQAVLQVLQPIFDPTFSEHSYGFRPGRSAHQAVAKAQEFQQDGYRWVVDMDLEKFFDRVNHDRLMAALRQRLAECGLELHPEKTKIVYCKDDDRRGTHEHTSFDFLGYTFRPRGAKNRKGKLFISFLPGVSNKAAKSIRATIRSWRLGATRNNQSLEEIAKFVNPFVRGWVNYYGRFYKSALTPVLRELERSLAYWVRRKFKRFARHARRAVHWLGRVARREPDLFVLWQIGIRPATGQ